MVRYQEPPSDVVKAVFARVRERAKARKKAKGMLPNGGHRFFPTIKDVIRGESDLPALSDADPKALEVLMLQKVRLCCVIFEFKPANEDPGSKAGWWGDNNEHAGKDAKRALLVELTQLVMESRAKWFSERVLIEVLHMTAINLFRALPPAPYDDWDPEEDEAVKDPAWLHVKMVYDFLYYFLGAQQVDTELMYQHVSEGYIKNLIELFRTKDIAERECLQKILHKFYQRFLGFRPFIRKCIGEVLWRVTYRGKAKANPMAEEKTDAGIGDLLLIWGSIVSGFTTPLREENLDFLQKILIPLHKNRSLKLYHNQLGYCILHYIDKDPRLSEPVIKGLLRYWPVQSSEKEQLFIQELEEILDLASRKELVNVLPELFSQIARSIMSPHFQVSERALFLWNKDVVATITADHRDSILPILYPAITNKHWNVQVNELSENIIRMFKEMDFKLWEETEKAQTVKREKETKRKEGRLLKWEKIRKKVAS